MLVRTGGSSELKRVANFSVTHKAWGSVRWLEPVDVRSLPLKDVVQIGNSNVAVSIHSACSVERHERIHSTPRQVLSTDSEIQLCCYHLCLLLP